MANEKTILQFQGLTGLGKAAKLLRGIESLLRKKEKLEREGKWKEAIEVLDEIKRRIDKAKKDNVNTNSKGPGDSSNCSGDNNSGCSSGTGDNRSGGQNDQ